MVTPTRVFLYPRCATSARVTSFVCSAADDTAACSADTAEGLADSATDTADGLATETTDNSVTDSTLCSVTAAA